MKKWIIGIVTLFVIGNVLYSDAQEFALYGADPTTGREKGCYTLLDQLLQARSPADYPWTRAAETQIGRVLIGMSAVCALTLVIRIARSRMTRRSETVPNVP